MNWRPISQKEVKVILAAVVLAAVACFPSTSSALVGGPLPVITVPGSVTSDPPVEASLTTTTSGGWYTPQASLLGNQVQTLFGSINTQNATQLMPVTQGLPCDSYTPMVTQIAPALMQTYQAAISDTQQLMTELQGEDFSQIAANVQAPAELASTQANGQALLAVVQELRLMRAQLGALTMVVAIDKLHQLDAIVRPTIPRSGGGC
jgi:hypothetical protein